MIDFEVRRIPVTEARPFIEQWHYSRSCPTGFNIFFGAFVGDGSLYAVAAYGVSANMDKGASVARQTSLPVRYQDIKVLPSTHTNINSTGLTLGPRNCLELRRLCRQGEQGEKVVRPKGEKRANSASLIPLTRFLAICHRILKREEGVEYIISYSDPGELTTKRGPDGRWRVVSDDSRIGGIYRAANFQHLGKTDPQSHVVRETDGMVFHRRNAYREMKRWNAKHPDRPKSIAQVRKEKGLVTISTPPKDRWFLRL